MTNTYQPDDRFRVVKIWRHSGRRQVLEKNLTLNEARRYVNTFSQTAKTTVVFFKEEMRGEATDIYPDQG